MSRTTIKKYIHIYQTCGKNYEEILLLDDHELHVLFQEKEASEQKEKAIPERQLELEKLLPGYMKRLKKPGWTKELLYKEYCETSKAPYARSQFMSLFCKYIILSVSLSS